MRQGGGRASPQPLEEYVMTTRHSAVLLASSLAVTLAAGPAARKI